MKKVFFITLLIFLFFLETAYAEDTTYLNKGYGFPTAYPSNYRVLKNLRGAPLIIFFPGKSLFFNNSILISVSGTSAGEKSIEEYLSIYFKYDKTVTYAANEDSFSKYLKEAKKIMESFKFI